MDIKLLIKRKGSNRSLSPFPEEYDCHAYAQGLTW